METLRFQAFADIREDYGIWFMR